MHEFTGSIRYTYRMVSRVFRIPFRGGVAPETGILNMCNIILYVFLYYGSQSALSVLKALSGELSCPCDRSCFSLREGLITPDNYNY